MSAVRRSPRQHPASTAQTATTRPAKPACIPWDEENGLLAFTLVSCMESNGRWRRGIFSPGPRKGSPRPTRVKATSQLPYYEEIARAIFSQHSTFRLAYLRNPASFARAVKEKLDSVMFPAKPKAKSKGKVSDDAWTLFDYRQPEAWAYQRRTQYASTPPQFAIWRPRLPIEIQFEVIRHAITLSHTDGTQRPVPIDYAIAANLSLVNRTYLRILEPFLYSTVVVRNALRFSTLFSVPDFLSSPHSPALHTNTLKLFVPPPEDTIPGFGLGYGHHLISPFHRHPPFYAEPASSSGYHSIPSVHFDLSSARAHFPIISRLPRETHIQSFVSHYKALYQLLLVVKAESLTLFMSAPVHKSEDTGIWAEVLSAHLAILKGMWMGGAGAHIKRLEVDGDAWMGLLPKCVRTWAFRKDWETTLKHLKNDGENEDVSSPLLDNTHITELTFRHLHVPTLAFLARMSRAAHIQKIYLAGWNTGADDIPSAWVNFVREERDAPDAIIEWVDW